MWLPAILHAALTALSYAAAHSAATPKPPAQPGPLKAIVTQPTFPPLTQLPSFLCLLIERCYVK